MKSHVIRGALLTCLSGFSLYLLMFMPRFSSFGIPAGMVLTALVVTGVLDWMGALKWGTKPAMPSDPTPFSLENAPFILRLIAGFNVRMLYFGLALLAAGVCRLSVIGTMAAHAPASGPILLAAGAVLIGIARFIHKPDFDGNFHEGFLVFWMAFATVMATLGSQGLWDCWETHYGEVARRQLEQDDWISLFWEDNWFFSKPILIFWMMNLGMSLFGVDVRADHLSGYVEWGVRFSVALLAVFTVWAIYQLLAKRVSKRAGLFSALVLSVMPLYGFMTRQAITDMPFVGFMTLAVIMFLLGITVDKETETKPIFIRLWKDKGLLLNGFHGIIAGYLAVGVPQFLYLASRSAAFRFGTFGRDDLRVVFARNQLTRFDLSDITHRIFGLRIGGVQDISLDWLLLGLAYFLPFALILFTIRKERRVSRLCFHGVYLFLALSFMAKGAPGLVLPVLATFGYWTIVAPWKDFLSPRRLWAWHFDKIKRIELLRGSIMFLALCSPWYIAMTVRHGQAFLYRFFVHDHFKRLALGVHGESGTFQYFMQEFGYAAFPFAALLPFALLAWPGILSKDESLSPSDRAGKTIRLFMTSLAIVSYALFTMMVTKFHHYVFPLLIPSAVLIGMFIDDIWQNRVSKMGLVIATAVVIVAAISQDMVIDPLTKAKGVLDGHTQLVALFIYKYSRPYPTGEAYNFFNPLLVFSILFGVLFLGWLYTARRRAFIVLTLLAGLAFSHFITQHYMVQLAPHWTQKHLIEEYYRMRESDDERLIAFQMNWKGENFYTGNRMIPFVSTKNKDFDKWVEKHRDQRHFFITEQSRFTRMSSRIKAASEDLEALSDTCNKYKIGVAEKL